MELLNSMEHIRKLLRQKKIMLLQFKIIALSEYNMSGSKIVYSRRSDTQ